MRDAATNAYDWTLALIPARGGSKSIPKKNLRHLGRHPLIAYSISAARAAESVDRVIVSTDDPQIAAVALTYGAEAPFLRPAGLAGDDVPDLPVFAHALRWLEASGEPLPSVIVHVRPTSPLRPPGCIDDAVAALRADPDADSVRSVTVAGENPYKMWRLEGPRLAPLLEADVPEPYNMPRQALPTTYWQTGHVDAVRTRTIAVQESMTGREIRPLLVDPAYAVDIDGERQWAYAEWIVVRGDLPIVPPHRPVRTVQALAPAVHP